MWVSASQRTDLWIQQGKRHLLWHSSGSTHRSKSGVFFSVCVNSWFYSAVRLRSHLPKVTDHRTYVCVWVWRHWQKKEGRNERQKGRVLFQWCSLSPQPPISASSYLWACWLLRKRLSVLLLQHPLNFTFHSLRLHRRAAGSAAGSFGRQCALSWQCLGSQRAGQGKSGEASKLQDKRRREGFVFHVVKTDIKTSHCSLFSNKSTRTLTLALLPWADSIYVTLVLFMQ